MINKLKRTIFFAVSCSCLLLLPGMALAQDPPVIRSSDNISKIIHIASDETVTINKVIYKIPPPWQGKKLAVKKYTYEDFALIPRDTTYQNSSLYLLRDANKALTIMTEKAKEEGVALVVHSSYRSSSYQRKIFLKLMEEGRSFDDIIRYVAPPGYSEHMLGTVVDFYPSNWEFASTEAYTWLKVNGQQFGFSETYPEAGSKAVPWEPWHWRYIPSVSETSSK